MSRYKVACDRAEIVPQVRAEATDGSGRYHSKEHAMHARHREKISSDLIAADYYVADRPFVDGQAQLLFRVKLHQFPLFLPFAD